MDASCYIGNFKKLSFGVKKNWVFGGLGAWGLG